MKKIILGFLVSLSFSFACDKPYEEIQNIKIGCEFEGGEGFKKLNQNAVGSNSYSSSKDIKFFDSMEVFTDENNKVTGIGFVKTYPITMSNMKLQEEQVIADYKQFAESLEKRWGSFDKSNANGIFSKFNMSGTLFMRDIKERIENDNPRSDVLGKIGLLLSFKTDDEAMMRGKPQTAGLVLIYADKEAVEEGKKEAESITDGF